MATPFFAIPTLVWVFIILIVIWETIWKGIALWRSAGNKQLVWFLVIFVFNTAGILPIIYLVFFQPKKKK